MSQSVFHRVATNTTVTHSPENREGKRKEAPLNMALKAADDASDAGPAQHEPPTAAAVVVMDDANVYFAAADVVSDRQQQQQVPRRSSLPPIALARPVNSDRLPRGLVAFHSGRLVGVNVVHDASTPQQVAQQQEQQQEDEMVVVLSRTQADAVEQYRWAAFFIFLLYVMTFFAWPSYLMSAVGLATGLVGYSSCRMTQQGSRHNLAWVILFIACNYVMMVFLVWVFISLFVRDVQHKNDGRPAMVLLAVFVVIGLLLHSRAQRVARDFLQEFRGGVTRMPRSRRTTVAVVRPRRSLFVHDATSVPRSSGEVIAHAA